MAGERLQVPDGFAALCEQGQAAMPKIVETEICQASPLEQRFETSVAFLGSLVFSAQKGFWLVLGLLYLSLGILVILNAGFGWGIFGRLSVGRLLPRHHALGMGFLFGLNLPACAYPLLLVLLGRSVTSGAAWGFAALFVFGLALSLPLLPLALSERTEKIFARLSRFSSVTPYAIGLTLLAISAYVLYTATPYFDLGG